MKKTLRPILCSLILTLLTGCLNLEFGGGTKSEMQKPTVGQQMIDLQKAKDAGAISDAEYQAQKSKILGEK
jgi:hypothetical protein